tara:strand:+ start:530 stop:790 length:261 start_codon:yes stop_codon:yes gene_type:complete
MAIADFTAAEIHFTCCFFGIPVGGDNTLPELYVLHNSYMYHPSGDRLHVYTNGYVVEMADESSGHHFQRDMGGLYNALQILTEHLA